MNYLKTLIVGFILIVGLLVAASQASIKQMQGMMNEVTVAKQETEDLRTEISSLTDAYEAENASLTDALEELKEEIKLLEEKQEETQEEDEDSDNDNDTSMNDTDVIISSVVNEATQPEDNTVVFDEQDEYDTPVEEMINIGEIVEPDIQEEETVTYGQYSEEDIFYLQRVAETETYGADMMSKTHVVSVVLNRLNAGTWGSTVRAVVTSPNQFAYGRTSISQSTVDAVNYVLENGDTAQGAMYFHSGAYSSTFCGRSFIFGDDCGHYFY